MAHPYAGKCKTGGEVAKSRYADGGAVDDVKDILLDQRAQNESEEQQGAGRTRNMVDGPTPQNLRNKQWTDATDGRGKTGKYGAQFTGREDK